MTNPLDEIMAAAGVDTPDDWSYTEPDPSILTEETTVTTAPDNVTLTEDSEVEVPQGFNIHFGEPPKRKTNLVGRQGIKWEDLLSPMTDHVGEAARLFHFKFTDASSQKRRTNLAAAKASSIRKRLENHVADEDWDVFVRTDESDNSVGVWARYNGELTAERKEQREEKKRRYQRNG